MSITKQSPSFPVTAEADLSEAKVKEVLDIVRATEFVTQVDVTSGGITVTLTVSGSTVTVTNATGTTALPESNVAGIAAAIIAYLDL